MDIPLFYSSLSFGTSMPTTMRIARVLVALALGASTASLAALSASAAAGFTKRGTVTRIIDGETLSVRLVDGTSERVRLVGIDGPAVGACWSREATADMNELVGGKLAWLVGDPTQGTRDREGRLVAYVVLSGGIDLGFELVKLGDAKVLLEKKPFKELAKYRRAEAAASALSLGVWACSTNGKQANPKHEAGEVPKPENPSTARTPGADRPGRAEHGR